MKYEKLTFFTVKEKLLEKKIKIFTLEEFKRIFESSEAQTKYFLENYTKKGAFRRLKRGLYSLRDLPLSEEEIANILYKPSYISFEYALSYYGIIPEASYEVTSATTKPTRIFFVEEKTFSYFSLKEQVFTGYDFIQKDEKRFLVAQPEKALLDYLYLVSYGEKPALDRVNINNINKKRVNDYLSLFGRKALEKLLKNILGL